ncbi:MAG: D-glycero-beta-D-manno-heptose 1,7-bisphosphate 7-phosphatase [Halioglobus sp.]
MTARVVILDRDGVINEDSDNYIRSLADWRPIAGSIEAISALSQAGYTVAIATNQSGLGRGYFELEALESIHAKLNELVAEQGGAVSGIFYCPHTPQDHCQCRKPATGLLRAIESELCVNVRGAFFIGDSLKDLQAGESAGCRPVLVKTGKGIQTLAKIQGAGVALDMPKNIPVFADLAEATRYILEQQH